MDAVELIRGHINSTLDGIAADHLLTQLPLPVLCAALVTLLQSGDDGAIRDACLVIRDGALMASSPLGDLFRLALREVGMIDQIEENLFADNHFTRDTAVYTLGKIDASESLPALRRAFTLYRDSDPLLIPGVIFESAWLGADKWALIDSAIDSPVYATRWSTIPEVSRDADDPISKAKQFECFARLLEDENALVRGEATYAQSLAVAPREVPRTERKRQRRELERFKPPISFADCDARFSTHLSQSGQRTYTVRELETFIAALSADPSSTTHA